MIRAYRHFGATKQRASSNWSSTVSQSKMLVGATCPRLRLTAIDKSTSLFFSAAKAIALDPNFSKAYWRRASAHQSILDPKAALPDLRRCAQLEPKNASVRQSLDATLKLIRRLEFEKAIKKEGEKQAWRKVMEHLLDGSGGTSVPDSYNGPKIEEAPDAMSSEEQAAGKITKEFVEGMIKLFKEEGKLPLRYAWQIVLGAKLVMDKESSLVDYKIPQQQTVDVVGDT